MKYCEKIAFAMGLSEKETADLKTTALLHDVGEVVIPASLLNKPEKLSEAEYEQIKIHSEKGYQILKSIDEYAALAESVLQHHEGLREGDILLHSRIINVADAYEAMTSDRPYKKALTQKEAVDELKKCRGKQFDPEIVDIFIEKVLLKKDQSAESHLS
jgi:HD-GYP domain-containing protein (c-di-GMP phosphodiesterase class II)